jgi:cobalamin biosynthesis Mg chelatase CobN
MKRIILFTCICLLFFAGCRTPQKIISNTTESIKTSEQHNETSTAESYSFVDTTKKAGFEINYYRIEFYPPEGPAKPDTTPNKDNIVPEGAKADTKQPTAGKAKADTKQPAIKSIEGYTVKSISEENGVTEEKSNTATTKDAENNTDINKDAEITEQPAPDPYRWRYILGILVLVVVVGIVAYFKLKKTKIIGKIVVFLKKLF